LAAALVFELAAAAAAAAAAGVAEITLSGAAAKEAIAELAIELGCNIVDWAME